MIATLIVISGLLFALGITEGIGWMEAAGLGLLAVIDGVLLWRSRGE